MKDEKFLAQAAAQKLPINPSSGAQAEKIVADIYACPSSDNLRHFGQFSKGGSGSSGLEFKRLAADAASVWS
jgi:hypothetical protein